VSENNDRLVVAVNTLDASGANRGTNSKDELPRVCKHRIWNGELRADQE